MIAQTDLAPTILDIAGCEAPEEMQLDGQSIKSLLTGEGAQTPRDQALLEVVNSRAVVSGNWKYIANRLPEDLQATADLRKTGWFGSNFYDNKRFREAPHHAVDRLFPAYFKPDQLYNLESDPCEQKNLSEDPTYAPKLAQMKTLLRSELAKLPHKFGEFTDKG